VCVCGTCLACRLLEIKSHKSHTEPPEQEAPGKAVEWAGKIRGARQEKLGKSKEH